MDFTAHQSPAFSSSTTTPPSSDPMQSWWESISKARSRILSLSDLLSPSLSSLADSDNPSLSFLSSSHAYSLLSHHLNSSISGSGSDPLCQWFYDTWLTSDPNLRLVVLSFLPLLSGVYLSRLHTSDSTSTPSLSGFEAVLLVIYATEVKTRGGKPVVVQIPDLSQPSLYHSPKNKQNSSSGSKNSVGVLWGPLEPQLAVKSTKRGVIVGVALDCYFKQISQMPNWSKIEVCNFAASWFGQDCVCKNKLDQNVVEELQVENAAKRIESLEIVKKEEIKGVRIPLPWEILQPLLRILGHCLLGPLNSQDVKDAASVAVRKLYARGSHDLAPQAILAARSLIQLDNRAREAAKSAAAVVAENSTSNVNTPSKAKKPEILLVSK